MAKTGMKRREFLRRSLQTTGGMGLYAGVGTLKIAEVMAQTRAFDDYKALVCVFLFGGNDSFNTVVPRSVAEYSVYAESRQNLAIENSALLPITAATPDGVEYGLHPSMPEFKALFDSGRMAVMANVGTLIEPVTLQQYRDKSVQLPRSLFSHNDQQDQWQSTPAPRSVDTNGWAGRTADVLAPLETSARLPMNLTLRGSNLLQVGNDTIPYGLSNNGAITYRGLANNNGAQGRRRRAFEALVNRQHSHVLEQSFADVQRRAFNLSGEINSVLAGLPDLATPFPENNGLADQLRAVARMIAVRDEFGASRQIFFVSTGGFDTHDEQNERQPGLLAGISQAVAAFNTATDELGVSSNVTTFTASDFGRTLTSNGDGTDHAWGSHQFIVGGAVGGQDIYGVMPGLQIDGPDDTGNGRLVPTTAVDQYAATLMRWFGLTEAELAAVFPNLANFGSSNIGFMMT